MKKDLCPHDISLFNINCKVKIKSQYCTSFGTKSVQALAGANDGLSVKPAKSSPDDDTTGIAFSVINFLRGLGNEAEIVSQSIRPTFYQVTLFDLTPLEFSATRVPLYGAGGVEAEITVSLLGEECKILTRFSTIPSSHGSERYYLEIRSLREFTHWYHQIFPQP